MIRRHSGRQRKGFALMAALWIVVLVGATGYELSVRSRARRIAVANALEAVQATAASEAGLETARAALGQRLSEQGEAPGRGAGALIDPLADLGFINADTTSIGEERFALRAYDAGTRLQINEASEEDVRRFLIALPLDARVADRLAQRILDWRDADTVRRAQGAERADYLRNGARVLPADAKLGVVDELRELDGMTPEVYTRVEPYLSVHGSGQINLNTAPRVVIRSLPGMGDEAVDALLRAREAGRPLRSLEELAPRVSSAGRRALLDAMADLMTRTSFDTREVVVRADGWVRNSTIRSHAVAVYTRNGNVLATTLRRAGR